MSISVKLDAFEGPLDLLLHLIDKNKINIYDIPIVEITEQYLEYIKEMERKFLSKTARTQGHAIEWYRDLLKFVSAEQIISLGDAFRRNEIATSNEIRQIIGLKRSNEPSADELRNPNIADKNQMGTPRGEPEPNQNDDQSLEYEGGVNE